MVASAAEHSHAVEHLSLHGFLFVEDAVHSFLREIIHEALLDKIPARLSRCIDPRLDVWLWVSVTTVTSWIFLGEFPACRKVDKFCAVSLRIECVKPTLCSMKHFPDKVACRLRRLSNHPLRRHHIAAFD
tara:strand:- start:7016 stop:7405 length:390 start_codon:yes stop_codon:yes gene_type:complete